MMAVEVKGSDPKNTWEIVSIYRNPKEEMGLLKKLADRTGYMGRTTKRSIIGGGINLPARHWYVLFLNMELHAGIHAEKGI
jgi:hypothetical protein